LKWTRPCVTSPAGAIRCYYPGSSSAKDAKNLGLGMEAGPPPREVCVFPFPYSDVILQGETKQLRLYEERFHSLFEDAMNNHNGVVAMGLLAESGIIQSVPLCEVEAYNVLDMFGSKSIFCTLRCVGRASLMELTQQEPYVKAWCTEITDKIPPNLELPTIVAGNIENFMVSMSSLEQKLSEKREEEIAPEILEENEDGTNEEGGNMADRIRRAGLEDAFYGDDQVEGSAKSLEDDDDDDDDDDLDVELDRTERFQEAFQMAKASDSQGYTISSSDGGRASIRTAPDLTALSWAAFCTDAPMDTHGKGVTILVDKDGNEYEGVPLNPTPTSVTYRIQALDCPDLFERLKLASFMLREKKSELQAALTGAEGKEKGKKKEKEDEGGGEQLDD